MHRRSSSSGIHRFLAQRFVRMDYQARDENMMVITMARLVRIATTATAVVCCWLAYAATAALACGSDYSGPVVEHGRSRGGQRWFQLACLTSKNHIEVDISLPGPGGTDSGGGMLQPMPTPKTSVYIDAPGVGFGAHSNEDEIDGVALRTTVRLKLYYRKGKPRTTRTVLAPAAERRRFHYLRGLRFFVYFFVDPHGLPQRVCGFDARGRRTSCERVLGQ
ncbi:MAG: hypothetical protein ACXVFQ_24510 [Solirubrobacteraceae bacterium]